MADTIGMEQRHSHQDSGFQYTIFMELDRINRQPVHMILKGRDHEGSLCGALGPQDPFSPTEFYSIHISHSTCNDCKAVWTAERDIMNNQKINRCECGAESTTWVNDFSTSPFTKIEKCDPCAAKYQGKQMEDAMRHSPTNREWAFR